MKMYVKTANEEKKINNVIGYIKGSSEPGMSEVTNATRDVSKSLRWKKHGWDLGIVHNRQVVKQNIYLPQWCHLSNS